MSRRFDWILVVEDEPDHRLLITEAIRRAGGDRLPIHTVSDGGEAQAWLTAPGGESGERAGSGGPGGRAGPGGRGARGLVILDLGLPWVSGFQVLEWLRDRPELRDVAVVVFTASENPLDAEHAFALGAKGYYQKPTGFDRYIEIFGRLLMSDGTGPAG